MTKTSEDILTRIHDAGGGSDALTRVLLVPGSRQAEAVTSMDIFRHELRRDGDPEAAAKRLRGSR